jgi:hypothetical protein
MEDIGQELSEFIAFLDFINFEVRKHIIINSKLEAREECLQGFVVKPGFEWE